VGPIAACATLDLFLQHPDGILVTYVRKQLKHFETYVLKHLQNTYKTLESHYKHIQHLDETLATYV
jgi:hypothetical protein